MSDIVMSTEAVRSMSPMAPVVTDVQPNQQSNQPAAPASTATRTASAPNEAELTKAVNDLNNFVQSYHRELQFSVDKDLNKTIIKVLDSDTKEVIRQIPPEEVIEMSRQLEEMVGLIVETKA